MSSNCPPQLHLTIPPNATSFKRSFSQFGLDLSPVAGGADAGDSSEASNGVSREGGSISTRTGNERKRARSASSLSDGNDSLRSSRSSTFTASSDTSLSEDNQPVAGSSGSSSSHLVTAISPSVPPRLPTPDIHDVEMPDYQQHASQASPSGEDYRISLAFDSDIDILPHSRRLRSPTPPPILPPLSLSEEEDQSAEIPFLHSPATGSSRSTDRLSLTSSTSQRDDLSIRTQALTTDAPPRLPSPVHPSPPLSAAIPASESSRRPNTDENSVVRDADASTQSGYVSFRERLNTAVQLLEADDVSAFRERLTSALDAVSTESRGSDVERSNPTHHTHYHDNDSVQTGPSGSRPWQASVLNNIRTDSSGGQTGRGYRTRNPIAVSSSTSASSHSRPNSTSDSRIRPFYQSVLRPLDLSADSSDVSPASPNSDTELPGGRDSTVVSSSLFGVRGISLAEPSVPNGRPMQRSSPHLSSDLLFGRRTASTSTTSNRQLVPNSSNRELERWFESPSEPSNTSSEPFSLPENGFRFTTGTAERGDSEPEDDEWASLLGRSLATTNRIRARRVVPLPGLDFSSANSASTGRRRVTRFTDDDDNDDQDREDEDIIASLLSSTQERINLDSPISPASSTGAVAGSVTGSRFDRFRVPPSLSSLIARDGGNLSSTPLGRPDNDNDVAMQSADTVSSDHPEDQSQRTEREPEQGIRDSPRRYSDVLSMSDYRSQFLADARRRYIEQGLLDPREVPEGSSERIGEQRDLTRRSSAGRALDLVPPRESSASAGYRLTAHPVPEVRRSSPAPVRWQFSWNDALDLDRRDYSDGEEDEVNSAIRRELADYQRSRQQRPRIPRSSLFASRTSRETFLNRRSSLNESVSDYSRRFSSSHTEDITSGLSSTIDDSAYQRFRSRTLASTRPSASNSLVAENASEIRRRSARADLMEHLFNENPSYQTTSRDHASWRNHSSMLDRLESYPVLPPLPYQQRSPSPSDFPRSVGEVLDAADRESEAQERRSREEAAAPRHSSSLSWLPPPQFENLTSFADSLSDSLWTGHTSDGGRDNSYSFPDSSLASQPQTDRWRRRAPGRMTYLEELPRHARQALSSPTFEPDSMAPSATFPRNSTSHGSSWSSARSQPSESTGFSDSRQSSLPDLPRMIPQSERYTYTPARLSTDSDFESASRVSANSEDVQYRPLPMNVFEENERRFNSAPAPSIPPPDLGALFSPNDLRADPFEMTFAPSSPENMSQSQPVPPPPPRPSQFPNIDVDSFAPGPFRSTMQRFAEQSRLRQTNQEAPSIPPLRFDEEFDFTESRSVVRPTAGENPDSTNARQVRPPRNFQSGLERDSSERTAIPPRPSLLPRYRPRETPRTASDDIHEAITRRVRMEGSIIEGSVPTTGSASTPNTTLGDESFNRAIEVLRQDGLSELRSQQFINRHRQRRDAAPTTTSAWGDIESNPNPYPFTYRFPSWHSRANELNNGSGSLSTANNSTATSRMGNTATRRRPSPGRSSDILSDARPGRPRPNRLGRHRPELSLGDSFVTLSDLVNRTRRPPRGNFNLGDYIRDEDFDQSYEGLVSLAATLGEVKPRSTPDHVVAGLKTGFYKDWATESSDKRCPICLDDYKALDPVLKLNDCSHWLHKSCLEQWLKGANTCPVCRNPVQGAASQRHLRVRSQLYRSNTSRSGGSHLHSTNSSEGSFDNTSTTVNSFSSIPAQASNQSTDPSSNSDSGPTSDIDSSSVNTFTARGGFRNFRRFY